MQDDHDPILELDAQGKRQEANKLIQERTLEVLKELRTWSAEHSWVREISQEESVVASGVATGVTRCFEPLIPIPVVPNIDGLVILHRSLIQYGKKVGYQRRLFEELEEDTWKEVKLCPKTTSPIKRLVVSLLQSLLRLLLAKS